MSKKLEEKQINIRTDLAIEAREMIHSDSREEGLEIEGVKVTIEEYGSIKVSSVEVLDENGVKQMGKPIGKYVTVECEEMKINAVEIHEQVIKILAEKLSMLHKLKEDSVVLVVGLGNWNVTPDALGPSVASQILVTRHLSGTEGIPKELIGALRPVCAITPGVMGITGIESGEIVKGVVERVKPDLVIAIDALAARRTNRVNATIQISDTGVNPGAGIGNRRMPINEEVLGIPVIAVGVPTVVDAATLVNDTMDKMLAAMIEESQTGTEFYGMLRELEGEEKYKLITDILDPYTGNMFVTPKEVDSVIDRLSGIIGNSINIALHPGIGIEDINKFIN